MSIQKELLESKVSRIKAAAALKKPDRVPVVMVSDAFCATRMGVKLSEFITDVELAN